MNDIPNSLSKIKKIYVSLESPKTIPNTNFKSEWVGPIWFQRIAKISLNFLSFKNWWGKSFDGTETAYNLFTKKESLDLEKKYPMKTYIGLSKIDNKPCLFLEYGKNSPFPWPLFVDEFRVLPNGSFLGMNYPKFLPKLALPFLIHPS
ncbi:hypothetical protein P3G55_07625 [Leptospira sp. 96542]|nr:hypothetical protein [Leptospira sp. 96542]